MPDTVTPVVEITPEDFLKKFAALEARVNALVGRYYRNEEFPHEPADYKFVNEYTPAPVEEPVDTVVAGAGGATSVRLA